MVTVEDLVKLAFPNGDTDTSQEALDVTISVARREYNRASGMLVELRRGLEKRQGEHKELSIMDIIHLPVDVLIPRWTQQHALDYAIERLKGEIADAEEAITSLEAQIQAAEELYELSGLAEGSTLKDLQRVREGRRREYEERMREAEAKQAAAFAKSQAEDRAEMERVNAMPLLDVMKELFTTPHQWMVNALVYGVKDGDYRRNNFNETRAFLEDRFRWSLSPAKRRMYERLWERYEEVSMGKVHKAYPR